jgi:hypothetical protein
MYWRDARRAWEASGLSPRLFCSMGGSWRVDRGERIDNGSKGDLVHGKSRKPSADPAGPNVVLTRHKFSTGTFVTLLGKPANLFKVTRLLPDGGAGLQYRIKSEREDYERVAAESQLAAAQR